LIGVFGGKFEEGEHTYFHRKLGHEMEENVLEEFGGFYAELRREYYWRNLI
jgi:hypothetical protein